MTPTVVPTRAVFGHGIEACVIVGDRRDAEFVEIVDIDLDGLQIGVASCVRHLDDHIVAGWRFRNLSQRRL